jgi:hypothetical protein
VVLAAVCVPASAAPTRSSSGSCALSPSDQAWLDRSVAAWNFTARNITRLRLPSSFEAEIFDAHCVLKSSTALAGGANRWSAAPHLARIKLPTGESVPVGVTSFASGNARSGFFVMSTPSVWRGKVKGGPLGLDTLMVAVLLHEGSHVAQVPTYGKRMDALSSQYHLPDSFGDDSIQERFQHNREFAASVDRETGLLLDAARSQDRKQAVRLASEARRLMRARQARWFKDGYLAPAEDIWLTMEGSAQWAGYQWLVRRGGYPPAVAEAGFGTRGKKWTQKEGFALFMALDRLTGGSWKRHAFGDGVATGLDMLDKAIGTR